MASAWVAMERNTLVAFSKMFMFILLHCSGREAYRTVVRCSNM